MRDRVSSLFVRPVNTVLAQTITGLMPGYFAGELLHQVLSDHAISLWSITLRTDEVVRVSLPGDQLFVVSSRGLE